MDREGTGPVPFIPLRHPPRPHQLPQGLPRRCWTPNRGRVPLGIGSPPLPQPPLRGAGPGGAAFTFAPPSLPPTPSGPLQLDLLGEQRIRPGISAGSWGSKWEGETWPCSLLILCPPSGSPISRFWRGIPSPPPAAPQGRQSHPASTSPLPSHPPRPTSYLVARFSSRPLRCPWSPTGAW